jgi:DNA-binding transcriptional regulator YiaG
MANGVRWEAFMKGSTRAALYCAMVLFTIVSMWTTYKSLKDSILPGPAFDIPLGGGVVWEDVATMALLLSVAIGLMLFSLKLAIIDGQKRLNVLGILGLTIIAFISICFNMDVLYRTADQEFFLRQSDQNMRGVYENYLAETQAKLGSRKEELLKLVARQEGELESEIRGLRQRPAGYGSEARKEDYQLTLLTKEAEVELESINQAMTKKEQADALLAETQVTTLEDIHHLQEQLRVTVKDFGALAGVPLPAVVKQEMPFMLVFEKLFNFRNVGVMEVLILFLAFLLDLGDIIGYSLIPNKAPKTVARPAWATTPVALSEGPEFIRRSPEPAYLESNGDPSGLRDPELLASSVRGEEASVPVARFSAERRRRPFRFRRR